MFDKCEKPTRIIQRIGSEKVINYYPCGQCLLCKQRLASEWSLRGYHELFETKKGSLLTLTYDNKNLPRDKRTKKTSIKDCRGTLQPKDMELFIKRLRKKLAPLKIRYIYCGEYGTSEAATKRPHYHILIYGILPTEIGENLDKCPIVSSDKQGIAVRTQFYDKLWGKGITALNKEPVLDDHAISYVTGYIRKKRLDRAEKKKYTDNYKIPPYQRQSQGIGRYWCDRHTDIITDNFCIPHNGTEKPVPRYYIKRILKKDGHTIRYKKRRLTEFKKEGILKYDWNYLVEDKQYTYEVIHNFEGENTQKIYGQRIKKYKKELEAAKTDVKNEFYFENLSYLETKIKNTEKQIKYQIDKFLNYKSVNYDEIDYLNKYKKRYYIDNFLKKYEEPYKEWKDYNIISEEYTNYLKEIQRKKVHKILNGNFGKRLKV